MYGFGHERGRIVGDLPGQIVRETRLQIFEPFADGLERGNRVGAGRLVDRDRGGRAAIEPRLAVEIGGAQLQPGDVAKPEYRAIRIGAHDYLRELFGGGKPALGLDVQLQLLVVRDRACADAPHRRLHILRLDRVDDIAGGQV